MAASNLYVQKRAWRNRPNMLTMPLNWYKLCTPRAMAWVISSSSSGSPSILTNNECLNAVLSQILIHNERQPMVGQVEIVGGQARVNDILMEIYCIL